MQIRIEYEKIIITMFYLKIIRFYQAHTRKRVLRKRHSKLLKNDTFIAHNIHSTKNQ